jgi:hypothetical protein
MTMLRYFFEKNETSRRQLFDGLAIAEDAASMAHQGRYPVIFLSLKDVTGNDWDEALDAIQDKLSFLFTEHSEVSESLDPVRQEEIREVRSKTAGLSALKLSLKNLITWLHAHYGQPVVVLIDEYDSPVIEAWNKGYYEEMIDFMRSWLGSGLKHENAHALYRAVVTGILRVARESVFSGLNNLSVISLLKAGPYADKFGFTEAEVDQVMIDFAVPELAEPIQAWYNGYSFGGHTIYNPWSVIQCISEYPNPIGPQWLNTASNDLIHAELEAGGLELKRDLEKLLAGEELRCPIQEHCTFSAIGKNREQIWSFLCFSGYLKAEDPQPNPLKRTEVLWRLSIPNLEVAIAYEQFIARWQTQLSFHSAYEWCQALLACDFSAFERCLSQLVLNLVSCHDVARYPEAAYHALVLGLLADLRSVYQIRSNPESGYGRADILMQPKTRDFPLAFIIEFKSIKPDADFARATAEALQQIENRAYEAQLLEAGVSPEHIHKLAIVFSGKRVTVTEG